MDCFGVYQAIICYSLRRVPTTCITSGKCPSSPEGLQPQQLCREAHRTRRSYEVPNAALPLLRRDNGDLPVEEKKIAKESIGMWGGGLAKPIAPTRYSCGDFHGSSPTMKSAPTRTNKERRLVRACA